jgi:hypothetical protein
MLVETSKSTSSEPESLNLKPGLIIPPEDASPKRENRIEDTAFVNEETSCGLSQSGDCWRPESLRGRVIHSPRATAADFAKHAMRAAEQAMIKVEPQVLIPTSSRPAIQRYPWK